MADDPTILCRPGDERFELVYFPNRIIVRTHEQISKPGEWPVRTRPVDRVYVPEARQVVTVIIDA